MNLNEPSLSPRLKDAFRGLTVWTVPKSKRKMLAHCKAELYYKTVIFSLLSFLWLTHHFFFYTESKWKQLDFNVASLPINSPQFHSLPCLLTSNIVTFPVPASQSPLRGESNWATCLVNTNKHISRHIFHHLREGFFSLSFSSEPFC